MLSDAETIAMVEELVGRARLAMVNTLNAAAYQIYESSQVRVPKGDIGTHEARAAKGGGGRYGPYPEETLAESGRVIEATPAPGDLTAQVLYDSPYATSQELGAITYESKSGKPVDWVAENYTTPGTGPHYLEDSAKEVLAQIPEELAIQGRIAMNEIPGATL